MFASTVLVLAQAATKAAEVGDTELGTLKKIISYALWIGLFACTAAMLYGGASWGLGGLGGNAGGQSRGKMYVICGAVGAVAVGLAIPLINGLISAAGANPS